MKITFPIIFILAVLTSCNLLGGSDNDDGPPRTIVFSTQDDDGIFQIYKMREDGSGIKRLTGGDYASIQPAWSPDGDRIAYARSFGSTAGEQLWVMDNDGDNKEPMVINPRTGKPQLGNYLAWSPDGSKVVFNRCVNCELGGTNSEIFMADLQTGSVDTLTNHPASDGQPKWSPDGNQLLFSSNRDYFDADTLRFRSEIYTISIDGKGLKRNTYSDFPTSVGGHNWISADSVSFIRFNYNSDLRDLIVLEMNSGEQHPVLTDLSVNQFWTFWNLMERQFLSIEKKHNEVPVILTLFDLDGNTLKEIVIRDPILKPARGFKWKTNK